MKPRIISKPTFNTERIAFNTGCFFVFASIIACFTMNNSIYKLQINVVKHCIFVVKAPKAVVWLSFGRILSMF